MTDYAANREEILDRRRRYYALNRERVRARTARYRRERKAVTQEALNQLKTAAGCADCGYNADAVALHFDHDDPTQKKFTISTWLGRRDGSRLVWREVEKCTVRCANCHAIRTYEENHYRVRRSAGMRTPPLDAQLRLFDVA